MVNDRVRTVLSRLWTDCCSVYARRPVTQADGSTAFREKLLHEALPCRLSFLRSEGTMDASGTKGMALALRQTAKLFLAPEHEVPPGSRIRIVRESREMEFRAVGIPSVYRNHQEIQLENSERWA